MADHDSTGKAPAFQFYPKDFEDGTVDLSAEDVGAYIRLLCHQWSKGAVPDDLGAMARVTRISRNRILGVWGRIRRHFTQLADGSFVNPRMERERNKQTSYRQRQAEAARKRWDKPDASQPISQVTSQPISQNDALHSPICNLQSADCSQKSTPTRGGVFRGERLGISKGQHAYLCRELGDASAYLLEWYPQWDAELVESGELFDTLEFCKRRAKELLLRQVRTGEAIFPPASPTAVAWLEECRTLHGGACGLMLSKHLERMAKAKATA